MKAIRHTFIFLSLASLLLAAMGILAPALAKSPGIGGSIMQSRGWCVAREKIFWSDKNQCDKEHGRFFKEKKSAQAFLDKQQQGFCCRKGRVIAMKKGDCLKGKGRFFTGQSAARHWCELEQNGFCCLGGRIVAGTKRDCLKKKGKFFRDNNKARDFCDPLGWCLARGKVSHVRRSACARQKGRFFTKKFQADQAARRDKKHGKPGLNKAGAASAGKKPPTLAAAGAGARGLRAQPFLRVEKIYLEHGTIRLRLKNSGKGAISPEGYRKGRLTLAAGSVHKKWALLQVDPGRALNRSKSISFDTRIKLPRQARVTAAFQNIPGQGKTALLGPPAGKEKTATTTIASRYARKSGDGKIHTPATAMGPGILKPGRNPSRPEPVPFRHDAGLSIDSPAAGFQFYRGETMQFACHATRDDVPQSGPVIIQLFRNGGGATPVIQTRIQMTNGRASGSLSIPSDIQAGDHQIVAFMSETGQATDAIAAGLSDNFYIHYNLARIDFITPERNRSIPPGNSIVIRYRLNHRVAPHTITFRLMHEGEEVVTWTEAYSPPSPLPSIDDIRETTMVIPENAPTGRYVIFALGDYSNGFSEVFRIEPIGEGDGTLQATVYDFSIADIFREPDGRVKARIRVDAEGEFVDYVPVRINDNPPERFLLRSPETEIVLDDMPEPILGPINRSCEGRTFQVTVDPANSFPETNERNNDLGKTLYYWEKRALVESPYIGDTAFIPCDETGHPAAALLVTNCGSQPIALWAITAHQQGWRPSRSTLAREPFDEPLPSNFSYHHPGIDALGHLRPGYTTSILFPLAHNVDSLVLFSFPTSDGTDWSIRLGRFDDSYGIRFNFGELIMDGRGGAECVYDWEGNE